MSLRSFLGGSSRVRKSSKPSSGGKRPVKTSSTWQAALPRKKPGTRRTKNSAQAEDDDDDSDDLFGDKLDDVGLVKTLATDLSLRDTSQAIQYIRNHMFSAIPDRATGMNSTRIAEVLNYRKRLPAIVTVSHIQTLLSSPSAVEREIAELARVGFIRKIVVARRGDIGETLILATDFEAMVQESASLDEQTKSTFLDYLRGITGAQSVPPDQFGAQAIDQLIKAGFLTAHHTGQTSYGAMSNTLNLYARPEDKGTLISLETVSRQPTGSLGTVGGEGAVHMAGGSGGGSRYTSQLSNSVTELKLAVPGNGTFLKLLSTALEHLVSLLGKSSFREAPETVLRERWNGGIAQDEARAEAKRNRREFAGILHGHTRKWKHFYGLSFDWVLQEAVGSGLVEVFETGSVGRGIRAR
jgi:hypothetical protein